MGTDVINGPFVHGTVFGGQPLTIPCESESPFSVTGGFYSSVNFTGMSQGSWSVTEGACPLMSAGSALQITTTAARFAQPLPCVHRGDPTGETQPCPTCTGTVMVPLLACKLKGTCTTSLLVPGVQCCRICTERPTA
jgi:hypothetical protein